MEPKEKEYKKDLLGDVVITSFIACFVLVMAGGLFDSQWLIGAGLLAMMPMFAFFVIAIFLRICDFFIELAEIFKGRR